MKTITAKHDVGADKSFYDDIYARAYLNLFNDMNYLCNRTKEKTLTFDIEDKIRLAHKYQRYFSGKSIIKKYYRELRNKYQTTFYIQEEDYADNEYRDYLAMQELFAYDLFNQELDKNTVVDIIANDWHEMNYYSDTLALNILANRGVDENDRNVAIAIGVAHQRFVRKFIAWVNNLIFHKFLCDTFPEFQPLVFLLMKKELDEKMKAGEEIDLITEPVCVMTAQEIMMLISAVQFQDFFGGELLVESECSEMNNQARGLYEKFKEYYALDMADALHQTLTMMVQEMGLERYCRVVVG